MALSHFEAVLGGGGAHRWIPALEYPALHDLSHGLARRVGQRVPQVRGHGVGVGVPPQVEAHPGPERLRTEVLLQHADQGRALLVGDHVEHVLGLGGGVHRVLHRPGVAEGVGRQRRGTAAAERRPDLPVGPVGVGAGRLHERGEGLVEPDALPPGHGHKVAEPHVGQLVVDHVGHHLQIGLARGGFVDQQEHFPEGHAAEVLHGTEREVGDGHQVELVGGVGQAVVVGVPLQRVGGHVEGEAGLVAPAGAVDHPHGHSAAVDRAGGLHRADHEGHQVRGHHHGGGEADPHPAVGERLAAGLGRVGHRQEALVHHQRCREGGFQRGFVEAGEGPPGVGGLELGGGDGVGVAGVVGVAGAVEAVELIVEHPGEGDVQPGRP